MKINEKKINEKTSVWKHDIGLLTLIYFLET